ncbi:MAG: septum formation family protein, partial [Chloroflexi bacterium]|nr:septum formation family protein [Chloroflexota bacterium]
MAVVAAALLIVSATACGGGPDRDESGQIVETGDLGVFDVRLGDCFDDPPSIAEGEDIEVDSLVAVPCSEPHDNEVYALLDYPAGDDEPYPGTTALEEYGLGVCFSAFRSYVGRVYESSDLDFFSLTPRRDGWEQINDREIICALYEVDLGRLTGSMKDI